MDFLYGELGRPARKQIEEHLTRCEACALQHTEFKATVTQLRTWQVAPRTAAHPVVEWPRVVRWAAAAALLVTTGFASARVATASLKPEAIQAQIVEPLREQISREVDAKVEREARAASERILMMAQKAAAEAEVTQQQMAATLARLKERDATLYAALRQIDAKWQAQNRSMREDLEKLALFTDRSVRSTERQLVQLTSSTQNLPSVSE